MKLAKARVRNYRSIKDTDWFEVTPDKTILVGPNEAGKTAVLTALQTLSMPPGEPSRIDLLRDYPRSQFSDVDTDGTPASEVELASAFYTLDAEEIALMERQAPTLSGVTELYLSSYYDGSRKYHFGEDAQLWGSYGDVEKPLAVLRSKLTREGADAEPALKALAALTSEWTAATTLQGARGTQLDGWLDEVVEYLDLDDTKTDKAFDAVRVAARADKSVTAAWDAIRPRIQFFVYFSQYFKVRPRIHLGRLASQEANGDVDEEYDFGNLCLLRLLGQSAGELAELGRGAPDVQKDPYGKDIRPTAEQIAAFQERIDRRDYRLNAAAIKLTDAINEVWGDRRELEIRADGPYLKVVVRNEDGARVELDQGSEGFRWLVSFYVVFQAQAKGEYANAILLLDEPGTSLHALKQKQFRETVSKLAVKNQTLFTTHSPFMVGSDEMDKVRIVEMKDRQTGTVVHEDFAVDDPRSLFPLQAHFGYELGQTLFGQHRNLVVEGITDYWYLEAAADAARDAGAARLDDAVTIIPAGDAGKVVYHATVLDAQGLRVAALFDSDSAGNTAASNETLVHILKSKQILRIATFYTGLVPNPETEDLLRDTLLRVARDELGIDAVDTANSQPKRPLCDVLTAAGGGKFSKYRLGKAFIRWMREHGWADLTESERQALEGLFSAVNKGTR